MVKKITHFFLLLTMLSLSWQNMAQVTIGSGTTVDKALPIDPYFGYSYSQVIYLQSEIGSAMNIGSLTYYATSATTLSNSNQWVIYIGHTTRTSFSSTTDWEPIASLTQVYSGTVSIAAGVVNIDLATPFAYNGTDNLIIAIEENKAGYDSSTHDFYTSSVTGNRSIYHRSDTVNANPSTPPTASGIQAFVANVTLAAPVTCPKPLNLAVSNITTNSADLSWTSAGSETSWNVQYGISGFTLGTGTIVNGVSNPYTASGLNSSTTYQFYVQADCGGGGLSAWAGPFAFTTACAAFGDFTEGFESFATNADPVCWSEKMVTTTSTPYIYVSSSDTHTGTRALRMGNSGDATAQLFAITPMLTDLPSQNHRMRFFVKGNANITFEVGTMTDPTNASSFTSVQTLPLTTSHQEFIVNFSQPTTDMYVAFKATYSSTYYFVSLDDVVWEPIPSCPSPTALTVSNITTSSATLGWMPGASETLWNVEYGVTGFALGTGTLVNGVNNPYSVSGLTADTQYQYYVKADCGGETSVWVGPYGFYTGHCIPVATSASSYINDFTTTGALTNLSNTGSGFTTGGYANNYSTMSVESFAGGTVNFNMAIVGGTVGAAIWVDFNNNLIFEVSEALYSTNAYGNGPFIESFAIPAGTANGEYRMRVMIDYNDSNPGDDGACGFGSGRGEVEDYKLIVSDAPTDAPDWYNMQWISDGTNGSNSSLTVNAWTTVTGYAQAWEPGVTDAAGQGAGLECWIGGYNMNTDPATWPEDAWDVATYNTDSGNNDEYMVNKVMDFSGTVYVASRWKLNGATFVYGGYNGPWNGTTNQNIQLIVNPILANDNCQGASTLTVNADFVCTSTTNATLAGATASGINESACYGSENDDVWFSFVATNTTHRVSLLNVSGTPTDLYHSLWTGDCNALTLVPSSCSDSDISNPSALTIGQTYYVRVNSYSSSSGANTVFDICIGTPPPPPANDACSTAVVVFELPYNQTIDAGGATNNEGFISACSANPYGGMNDGVWYTFTVETAGTFSVVLSAVGSWDPQVDVYSGSCGTFTCVASADAGGTGGGETISFAGVAGTTYYINVGQYGSTTNGLEGIFTLNISGDGTLGTPITSIDGFKMYPNPADNVLNVHANNTIDSIMIYSMLGQKVISLDINSEQVQLDLNILPTGSYIVKVQAGNQIGSYNLIKN